MTVIRPNSISGITSITAQGDTISLFRSDGTTVGALNLNVNASSGVSTFANLVVTDGINAVGVVTATSFSGDVSTNAIVNSGITTVSAGTAAAPSISPTGDSNTGVFFPSADTIAFAEGGTEAARFDSSGRFGVGTTSPASESTGSTIGILDISASSGGNLVLHRTGSSDTALFSVLKSSNGTYVDSTGALSAANNAIIFRVNNINSDQTTVDEALRINSNQELLVGTATRNANGGVLQLKSGITFPATAVAASDANTLDDYEEGTWTPEMADAFTGGNTAASYTAVYGDYVKIGRLVYVSAKVVYPVTTGMTSANEIFIRNLPFVAAVGQAQCYGAVFVSGLTYPAGYTFVQAWLNPNDGNTIRFVSFGSGQGYSPLKISNVTSGGSLLYFSIVINLF